MTNEEILIAALNGTEITETEFRPQNNKQAYLGHMVGLLEDTSDLPTPVTIEEALLYNLCLNGGAGGGSSLKLNDASYLFYKGARLDQFNELLKAASGARDMSYMFSGCAELTSLDMSSVDTSNAAKMDGVFEACYGLTELVGFSASGLEFGSEVRFPYEEINRMCNLKRLVFRTDLPEGQYAIKGRIDLSGAPMTRIPMVEMFESLPDVSKVDGSSKWAQIYIAGSDVDDGRTDVLAGSYDKTINTLEEFTSVIEDYNLREVDLYVTFPGATERRMGTGEILLNTANMPGFFPVQRLRWEDTDSVSCSRLTEEDKAIAINKGWAVIE